MSAVNAEASERMVLGACIAGYTPHAYRDAAGLLSGQDWWHPSHEWIWSALGAMHTAGLPVDPVSLLRILDKGGLSRKIGGPNGAAVYLSELVQEAAPDGSLTFHCGLIADAATMRRLAIAGTRIVQAAEENTREPADLVAWAAEQVSAVRDTRTGVDVLTMGWDAFIHSTPEDRPMVVPGLLGVGDRIVLTGSGGLGKSTMLQQFAVCAAAGLPPFDYLDDDPYEPVKVSIFDCENPDHRRKTRLWPMVNECVQKFGLDPRPNLTLGGHGNTFDLLNASNALSLLRTVEHDKPQLLYIGPAYKLHNDDPDKESVVKKITGVLDAVREMGVALITEAHPNKASKSGGPMSPSGSALWEWWPEFGVGLRLDPDSDEITRRCKLERWRIDREDSSWPLYVQASGDPGLPWERSRVLPPPGQAGHEPEREAW